MAELQNVTPVFDKYTTLEKLITGIGEMLDASGCSDDILLAKDMLQKALIEIAVLRIGG